MPTDNKNENQILHYLKAISMFDPETDYDNEESKRQLSLLFRKLIMSEDPTAKEFFTRFLKGVDKVIKDMGAIDSSATDDEVDMSPTPPEDESAPESPTPPSSGPGSTQENYNYLLDFANRYIYM